MKTYKHLYEEYISEKNIEISAHDVTLGKLKHKFLQEIKKDPKKYYPAIKRWACNFYNSYHEQIQIYDGVSRKKRTIVVPSDKEQFVHHMIINPIKPMIEHSMYEHAYGSVPGRGTEQCVASIKKAIKYHPRDCKYCLKMDIRHYFDSIDRRVIKKLLHRKIRDDKYFAVLCVILEYDKLGEILHIAKFQGIHELFGTNKPTKLWFDLQNAIASDDLETAHRIIASLDIPWELRNKVENIATAEKKGLPLGFYSSQWLSQFYLEGLDHFIKEDLQARFYWRFVDDQVIFDRSKRRLHKMQRAIESYLNKELHLEMKRNWQVFRFDYIDRNGEHQGRDLDFLGYRFYCDRTVLRRSIMLKATRKARRIYKKRDYNAYDARQLMSYMGRIEHSDTYEMFEEHIAPIVSIKKCRCKISAYDKARRKDYRCIQSDQTTSQRPPILPVPQSTAIIALT